MLTLDQIRQTVVLFFKDKPVKKVWLFGSYARGEADEASDLDLLVDLDYEQRIGFQFFAWPEELEMRLETPVDVVSSRGLSDLLAPYVHRDKQLLYAA